jgi:acyl-homoserine-lactone acylase
MRKSPLAALFIAAWLGTNAAHADDLARWRGEAAAVDIVRDNWGIAHIYGKTDANTVFGAIYAQAEDDFNRIERNYLTGLGKLAEVEGETAIYSDLRERLFIDEADLKRQFDRSPPWLKKLMIAWADGLNYYLYTHPTVKPKLITHFEPWMTLSFTEGSIGGDVESIDLAKLEAFYGKHPTTPELKEPSPGGSNGFAISPQLSASGHAMLWINPHTSFYFRSELQMVSQEGLNVYGAATWGQFFIYQGFNQHNGWMHTSYGGDAIDEYAETIVEKSDGLYYRYGGALKKLTVSHIAVPYRQNGLLAYRDFTVYRSHHGPIIRTENGKWIAIKLLQEPVQALAQSYLRTKTHDYQSFYHTQQMRTDTSNNTVYADGDGTIAYFHGNFIPKRNPKFDFTHPVDGSDPATEWQGPEDLKNTIILVNPKNGWLMNTNNWPFSAAGDNSPKPSDYPRYMWTKGENPRGYHAVELLQKIHDVTLDSLIATAYDGHLTAFDVLLPPLFAAYDQLPDSDPRRSALKEPIDSLRGWDHRTGILSQPTALAIFWGRALIERNNAAAHKAELATYDYLLTYLTDNERIEALSAAIAKLQNNFGTWRTAWGEINRYQRLTDDIVQPVNDDKPSLPVGLASSAWGALASFDTSGSSHTSKIYGAVGNSFIAAVDFGPKIHAKAVSVGGESGDPSSPHFTDQIDMYRNGQFRDVLFYKTDVLAHAERHYHPGE